MDPIPPEMNSITHETGLIKPGKSNLLSLLPELRDLIWQFMTPDEVVIVEYKNDKSEAKGPKMSFPQTTEARHITITAKDVAAISERYRVNTRGAPKARRTGRKGPSFKRSELNLLLVSRQIHTEFEDRFYFSKSFKFPHNTDFVKFIDMMGPRISRLRSLSVPVLANCMKVKHMNGLRNDLLHGFRQLEGASGPFPKLELELVLKFKDRKRFRDAYDLNLKMIDSYRDLFNPSAGKLSNLGGLAVKVRFAGEGEEPPTRKTKHPLPPLFPGLPADCGLAPVDLQRERIEKVVLEILRSKPCLQNSQIRGREWPPFVPRRYLCLDL